MNELKDETRDEFHEKVKMSVYRNYLVTCSEGMLLDHSHWISEGEQNLKDVVMVSLISMFLKSVCQIASCRALRICILANNFLTKIEPLMECISLVKLDLKGNQIVQLPDASGWSHLTELQLLYLHDNSIVTWSHVKGLSGCLNLAALTLFDTPLSLKKNYRHCMVNNIFSLKALDNFVISDEEIVQNWSLPFRFKALKPHFCVGLYPSAMTGAFETEMRAVYQIISRINKIQAFYSPTIVIQRWIRGYLIRKRLGNQKKIEKQSIFTPSLKAEVEPVASQPWKYLEDTPDNHERAEKTVCNNVIKRLHVNLDKLMQSGHAEKAKHVKSVGDQHELKAQSPTPEDSLKSAFQKGMFGQDISVVCNEQIKEGSIRVLGLKVLMHQSDPVSEMILSRKAAAQDVRKAITHFHKQKPDSDPQPHSHTITATNRTIGHCFDNISLAPFKASEKAHQVFQKSKMQRLLVEKVTEHRVDLEMAKVHRVKFIEDRRRRVRECEERDKAEMEKSLSLQRTRLEQSILQAHQKHSQFLEKKKKRREEEEMVCRFSGLHNS